MMNIFDISSSLLKNCDCGITLERLLCLIISTVFYFSFFFCDSCLLLFQMKKKKNLKYKRKIVFDLFINKYLAFLVLLR